MLTLSGSATVANYQTALRSVTYANSSTNPLDGADAWLGGRQRRHRELEHRDPRRHGRGGERPARGDDDGGALAFTEGNSATAIDTGLTVTDADSANLASATVASPANFVTGEDVLGFTTQNGITGSFNAHDRRADADRQRDGGELPDGAAVGDLREQQHQSVDVGPDGVGRRQRRHGELEHGDAHHHGGGGQQRRPWWR